MNRPLSCFLAACATSYLVELTTLGVNVHAGHHAFEASHYSSGRTSRMFRWDGGISAEEFSIRHRAPKPSTLGFLWCFLCADVLFRHKLAPLTLRRLSDLTSHLTYLLQFRPLITHPTPPLYIMSPREPALHLSLPAAAVVFTDHLRGEPPARVDICGREAWFHSSYAPKIFYLDQSCLWYNNRPRVSYLPRYVSGFFFFTDTI